jgi:hypothetical protein
MKIIRKAGATSNILQIFIADSSSTTGGGLTGLTSASSGLTAYYHRDTDTTATAISLVTMTVGTFTSSGFKEIDATNMPGWYQFCPPDAALTTGAKSVGLHLKGATNMAPLPIEIDLDSQVDVYLWNGTAVSSPATAGIPDVNVKNMNNVAATSITTINANQGTTQPVNFTGTGASALAKSDMVDIAGAAVSTSSAQIGVNAVNIGGTAAASATIGTVTTVTNQLTAAAIASGVWKDTTAGDFTVALSVGKSIMNGVALGTGLTVNALTTNNDKTGYSLTQAFPTNFSALSIDSGGVVKANLAQILGTALTETAGQIAAAFKKFFNIASPTSTMNEITLVDTVTTTTTATNLSNAPTAGDFTATMKTSIGTAVAASAVASVTGNVGGNVTGSVGSVVAAVAITSNRKKGSAATIEFTMQDATTGADKTGLTVAAVISKDGGAFASTTNSVTETANGWYQLVLTAAEMGANNIALQMTATGALNRDIWQQNQP